MKNKLIYLTLITAVALFMSSCASTRSTGSHRKGYGCPNSAGIKMEVKSKDINA